MKIRKSALKRIIREELSRSSVLQEIAYRDEVDDIVKRVSDLRKGSSVLAKTGKFAFDLESSPGYQLVVTPPESGQIDKYKHVRFQKKPDSKAQADPGVTHLDDFDKITKMVNQPQAEEEQEESEPSATKFTSEEQSKYRLPNLTSEIAGSLDEFTSYLEDFIPGISDFTRGLRGSASPSDLIASLLIWAFNIDGRSGRGSGLAIGISEKETLPAELFRNMINSGEPLPSVSKTNLPAEKIGKLIVQWFIGRSSLDVAHPAFKEFVRKRLKRTPIRNAMLQKLKDFKYDSLGMNKRDQEMTAQLDPNPKNDDTDIINIDGKATRIIYK